MRLKRPVLAACLALAWACIARAAAPPVPPGRQETCVDVQVGSAQSYDCLNQRLQGAARTAPRFSSDTNAPYGAGSPGNVTGQFNEGATRNRLGSNFGKSVTPERPVRSYAPPRF